MFVSLFRGFDAFTIYVRGVQFWDKAATEPKHGKDPDWAVGALVGLHDGVYYVLDIVRFRGTPQLNESAIRQMARLEVCLGQIWL